MQCLVLTAPTLDTLHALIVPPWSYPAPATFGVAGRPRSQTLRKRKQYTLRLFVIDLYICYFCFVLRLHTRKLQRL